MAITGEKTQVDEAGQKKECLRVSFTNGALQQLEELKKFIGSDDPTEVLKVGIAFVQRAKEFNEKNKINEAVRNEKTN